MCAIDRETRLTLYARWKLKEGRRHLACAFVGDKLKGENRFIDRKLPTKYCMSTCPLMTLSSDSHTHYVSVPIFRFPFFSKTYHDRTRRQTTNYSGLTSKADKIKVQGSRRRVKAHRRSALFARSRKHETLLSSKCSFLSARWENIFADKGEAQKWFSRRQVP